MTTPLVRPRRAPAPARGAAAAGAGAAAGAAGTQAPALPVTPFTRAARKKNQLSFSTSNVLGAAQVQLQPIEVTPGGFLRFIELQVVGTTAGNAAATAFAADAPWNVISFISLTNSAGDTIIVPVTGYQLFLINKYFAMSEDPPNCDPRRDPNYAVTTGAGATGGSFNFSLRIPLEIDPRDAFCAIPNSAANKAYQLQIMLAPTTTVYTTAPTAAPTVAITGYNYFWTQPRSESGAGNPQEAYPRGNGSVSLIRLQTIATTQGDKINKLTNVGNVLRQVMFVLRTAAGARSAADWPAISQFLINNDTMFYLPTAQWQADMAVAYGYNMAAVELAGGLDNGVFVVPYFNDQRGRIMCDGPRDQWLPTLDATLLQHRGTSFGATAATLEVITNEIKPVSADALYSPNVS